MDFAGRALAGYVGALPCSCSIARAGLLPGTHSQWQVEMDHTCLKSLSKFRPEPSRWHHQLRHQNNAVQESARRGVQRDMSHKPASRAVPAAERSPETREPMGKQTKTWRAHAVCWHRRTTPNWIHALPALQQSARMTSVECSQLPAASEAAAGWCALQARGAMLPI
jgi:hypothetical protein